MLNVNGLHINMIAHLSAKVILNLFYNINKYDCVIVC